LIEGDIRDPEVCARATRGVDGIIHMAALAGVRPSIAEPERYMDVNVTGTQRLLDAIRERPEVRFVFASSSSVYGGNEKVPFSEADPVDHPISPYAASKKAGELVCYTFHHLYGHPMTCLRFFTVYGPGQRPEMAIHLFSRKIEAGEEIPMFGDGLTSRDYTYVDDIVDGVVAAYEQADGYHVYNLGGSKTTTLAELIDEIARVFGKPANVRRLPMQPGDVERTWADVSRAHADLGYQPRIEVSEGLERFAAWYREEHGAGRLE
ncbi:MAG: GDP-mannose 4,6-dehydratase, partial [Planctomycetaceae bacterium]|nr:GDP-mannose 4,6-dehydratase [Planctomycetaceae bacterium]